MIQINRAPGPATESRSGAGGRAARQLHLRDRAPRAALMSALAMLFSEVEQTNRAANAHFATVSENPLVMKYMLLIYLDELAPDRARAGALLRGVDAALPGSQRERAVPGRQPAAPHLDGDERAGARRQTARDRRSVRRDARTARRLLPDRSQGSRRGDRHRRANPRARLGTVEIRPVMEIPGLPSAS